MAFFISGESCIQNKLLKELFFFYLGTSGEPIQLLANYFELTNKPEFCIYQYHCDFAPVVESSRMRKGMIREHRETFGNAYIFDGMSDLKTVRQLGEVCNLGKYK